MSKSEIRTHVEKLARLSGREKFRYLQALVGAPVDLSSANAGAELHSRALLFTRLNEAGIWPPRR